MNCECIHWPRTSDPYKLTNRGIPLLTNHHPNCSHYNDSLIDAWKVSIGGTACYYTVCEADAILEAKETGGEAVIVKEKIHREIFENLPEFEGF